MTEPVPSLITDAAVEAALIAYSASARNTTREDIEAALLAALPHIEAERERQKAEREAREWNEQYARIRTLTGARPDE